MRDDGTVDASCEQFCVSTFAQIRNGLLEKVAFERGCSVEQVIHEFRTAILDLTPNKNEKGIAAVIKDILETVDFSSPSIQQWSLYKIGSGFYRSFYLHAGWNDVECRATS